MPPRVRALRSGRGGCGPRHPPEQGRVHRRLQRRERGLELGRDERQRGLLHAQGVVQVHGFRDQVRVELRRKEDGEAETRKTHTSAQCGVVARRGELQQQARRPHAASVRKPRTHGARAQTETTRVHSRTPVCACIPTPFIMTLHECACGCVCGCGCAYALARALKRLSLKRRVKSLGSSSFS